MNTSLKRIKSKQHKHNNNAVIHNELKTLLFIPNLLGEIPLKSDLHISPYLLVLSMSTQVSMIALGIYNLLIMNLNGLEDFMQYLQYLSLGICLTLNSVYLDRTKNGLRKIARLLEKSDLLIADLRPELKRTELKLTYNQIIDIILIIMVLLFEISYISFMEYDNGLTKYLIDNLESCFYYYGVTIKVSIYRSVMTSVLKIIKQRFQLITNLEMSLSKKLDVEVEYKYEQLCNIHHNLVDTTDIFNEAFGVQLLGLTCNSFLLIVFLAYSLLDIYLNEMRYATGYLPIYFIINICCIIIMVYFIWDIVQSACSTSNMVIIINK